MMPKVRRLLIICYQELGTGSGQLARNSDGYGDGWRGGHDACGDGNGDGTPEFSDNLDVFSLSAKVGCIWA